MPARASHSSEKQGTQLYVLRDPHNDETRSVQ
jgi:hypothetical protein